MTSNQVTDRIIGAAIAVHREIGPGLLESTYVACLAAELTARGIRFQKQKSLGVTYRGQRLDCSYRVDLLVEDCVVVEVKSVAALEEVHTAQVITYLKFSGCSLGLILNFNVPLLRAGIKRIAYHHQGPTPSHDPDLRRDGPPK